MSAPDPPFRPGKQQSPPPLLRRAAYGAQHGLVAAILLVLIAMAARQLIEAARRPAPTVPPVMEDVNWSDPDSSAYCLACHKPVGPAAAGLDVEHGHPQNVALEPQQVEAVERMQTTLGPDGTLICMSCHQLGSDTEPQFMLAEELADGRFCEQCHPGHYARGTPHDLRISAPHERNRLGQTALEGGPCSACHLAHRYARDFEPCVHDPDGRCTTCHDVHGCASERARHIIDHPESRCLECHDPHEARYGDFLAAPVNDTCVRCHEGYDQGTLAGMHPIGDLGQEVPATLVSAGAQTRDDPGRVTCVVCHQTHVAPFDELLVMPADTNALCLGCHEDALNAIGAGTLSRHGQQPVLTEAQRALVVSQGGRVGPGGELLCVSCHRVHEAGRPDRLLTFTDPLGNGCSTCHPEKAALLGSAHDLAPGRGELATGMPDPDGACTTCHNAHGYALPSVESAADASGRCLTCHRDGGRAAQTAFIHPAHPETDCADCHDPHIPAGGLFLTGTDVDVCGRCHTDHLRVADGPHDIRTHGSGGTFPADAPPALCRSCHVAHGGEQAALLRVALDTSTTSGSRDDLCLACHEAEAWRADSRFAAIHPNSPLAVRPAGDLPLADDDDEPPHRMACRTCHDPHAGAAPDYLARVAPDTPTERLCLQCHQDQAHMHLTGHSTGRLRELGYDTSFCQPCHAMHAQPDGTWGKMLSPRFLLEHGPGPGDNTAALPCLACHKPGGTAPMQAHATHPVHPAINRHDPASPGFLPLFDDDGHIAPDGDVVCRTCHVSHGRTDLMARAVASDALTATERDAMRMQLRPFMPPNVCTDCHGTEARTLFLFFHHPEHRNPRDWRPPSPRP